MSLADACLVCIGRAGAALSGRDHGFAFPHLPSSWAPTDSGPDAGGGINVTFMSKRRIPLFVVLAAIGILVASAMVYYRVTFPYGGSSGSRVGGFCFGKWFRGPIGRRNIIFGRRANRLRLSDA
jgi:hypothetical protein